MKIGIDIRNIGKNRTGDEVVFFNLVKNLAQIDNKNEYFLFSNIINEKILRKIKKDLRIKNKPNFKIVSLKSSNKFIWNIWTLPKYLKKHPLDIYHTQYITPFFVSRKTKIITIIHDVSFEVYKQFIKWSDLFFLRILIPLSIRRANKIIAVSEFTKNEIIKYYKTNSGKIEVVYNAVSEAEKQESTETELEALRKRYNLPEKFILYIGTLQPRKNIPALIEAYAKIKNRLGGTKLVLAGNKFAHNFDKKIDAMIKNNSLHNEVLFPGFVDEKDKMKIISMAHLFAFPSLYEGFGIPILEAMIQNIPVVASDIPSLKEVGSKSYAKFNPEDLEDMAEKMYTSCVDENLRKNLAEMGKTRANFFSWKKSSEKMLTIYNSLKK